MVRPTTWDEKLENLRDMIATNRDELTALNRFIADLGKTDFHSGTQDLKTRLEIIEGCIDILHSSHLGHTNTSIAEFRQMHGFDPEEEVRSRPAISEEQRIYRDALRLWGTDSQVDICIEELAECIQALVKHRRKERGSTREEVAEEIADADICLSQMKLLFPEFERIRAKKLDMLRHFVIQEKQNVNDWNSCPRCGHTVTWSPDLTVHCDSCAWMSSQSHKGGLVKE